MARFQKGDKVFEITSADPRYATEQRKHLREGWTRVADPRCEVPLGAEPINATLEEAVRNDPNDIAAPLVYADWLQQQGHPRGALIAVQHRLAMNPRDAALIEAEKKIIEEARDSLVSKPMLAHLALRRGKRELAASRNLYEGGTVTFDHGFIREARVVLKQRGADEDLLWELLRHPSARMLSELDVTIDKSRDIALVATLLTHGPRPPLRSLQLRVEYRGIAVDLSGLDAAYPLIEELQLEIHTMHLVDLQLPRLRSLAVQSEHSDLGHILALRTWPVLEHLAITGNPNAYQDAFEAPSFPKLRKLAIRRPSRRRDSRQDRVRDGLFICRMVVRSPDVAHLERIELPGVSLSEESITMLVENRAKFEALATLEIETFGNSRDLERLREVGFPV